LRSTIDTGGPIRPLLDIVQPLLVRSTDTCSLPTGVARMKTTKVEDACAWAARRAG
jgi:hypothetical protein